MKFLSNSIKFTSSGYVRLTATNKLLINFIIEDTGSGIKPELLDILGQPYAAFTTLTN